MIFEISISNINQIFEVINRAAVVYKGVTLQPEAQDTAKRYGTFYLDFLSKQGNGEAPEERAAIAPRWV